MILAISLVVFVATSVIVLVREVRNAPEGYENGNGFLVLPPTKSAGEESHTDHPVSRRRLEEAA
jgi:hypothetical protein